MPKSLQVQTRNTKIVFPSFPEKAVLDNGKLAKFSFSENNKLYIAHNSRHLCGCSLRIDGKLYNDNRMKCDFGLLLQDGRFYLIEIKGGNVHHGHKQLLETVIRIKEDYPRFGFEFYCRVIGQKNKTQKSLPNFRSTEQRLIKKIGATHKNGKLLVREKKLEEEV